MIIAANIGTPTGIENWPTNDLEGLFDALNRWPLDKRLDYSKEPEFIGRYGNAPFRGAAWGHCVMQYSDVLQKRIAVATKPIYPEYPKAVRYCGNFIGYSFAFLLDTDDTDLISRLDHAIAENMLAHR
jgi:hypothetical protein